MPRKGCNAFWLVRGDSWSSSEVRGVAASSAMALSQTRLSLSTSFAEGLGPSTPTGPCQEGHGVGPSCGTTKHCTPTTDQARRGSGRAPDPVRSKASQKLRFLLPRRPSVPSHGHLRAPASLFPYSCPIQRSASEREGSPKWCRWTTALL